MFVKITQLLVRAVLVVLKLCIKLFYLFDDFNRSRGYEVTASRRKCLETCYGALWAGYILCIICRPRRPHF